MADLELSSATRHHRVCVTVHECELRAGCAEGITQGYKVNSPTTLLLLGVFELKAPGTTAGTLR